MILSSLSGKVTVMDGINCIYTIPTVNYLNNSLKGTEVTSQRLDAAGENLFYVSTAESPITGTICSEHQIWQSKNYLGFAVHKQKSVLQEIRYLIISFYKIQVLLNCWTLKGAKQLFQSADPLKDYVCVFYFTIKGKRRSYLL
ncbi:hypothetical protein CS542_09650 [Pedobacter sp. IW39]|nr:hypothetical protein CS542_09650 [Pedobacter sp. IW39]